MKKIYHLEPGEGVEVKQKWSFTPIKVRNVGKTACELKVEW